ncbi:hypothetical protein H696_05240 [Fonticula alba]|uniref:Uncharacterized protein n=1 Tax=Fonticula alba TaxID=691883 RepID=A0A058Z310_FONAL|nr:hypothetical protein H696_05240 [Fonticula alba]KCV68323.1 hypothetical protein H696_05240 [Fonticula alba]|eukprot:XP_009497377.1 hypothetical protein H696_05240 [Fonticula alba]
MLGLLGASRSAAAAWRLPTQVAVAAAVGPMPGRMFASQSGGKTPTTPTPSTPAPPKDFMKAISELPDPKLDYTHQADPAPAAKDGLVGRLFRPSPPKAPLHPSKLAPSTSALHRYLARNEEELNIFLRRAPEQEVRPVGPPPPRVARAMRNAHRFIAPDVLRQAEQEYNETRFLMSYQGLDEDNLMVILRHLETAASLGHVQACYELGFLMSRGIADLDRNIYQSNHFLHHAAEAGHPDAMFLLAMTMRGTLERTVARDHQEYLDLLGRLVDEFNYPPANIMLSNAYMAGDIVPLDIGRAAEHVRLALIGDSIEDGGKGPLPEANLLYAMYLVRYGDQTRPDLSFRERIAMASSLAGRAASFTNPFLFNEELLTVANIWYYCLSDLDAWLESVSDGSAFE